MFRCFFWLSLDLWWNSVVHVRSPSLDQQQQLLEQRGFKGISETHYSPNWPSVCLLLVLGNTSQTSLQIVNCVTRWTAGRFYSSAALKYLGILYICGLQLVMNLTFYIWGFIRIKLRTCMNIFQSWYLKN